MLTGQFPPGSSMKVITATALLSAGPRTPQSPVAGPGPFVVDGRGIIRMEHVGPIEPSDLPRILQALEDAR